ncbi:sensor histidine kinase [Paenibacillus sp. USDA918EY]|uniref:sensor histidine kinase n=1 Tax=Paenibacillus sp. USDA918EY TaxID=2689575 RepID=UPI00135B8711|nr:ATP-binding protein [Paenibacillus sp. USDA918EY]
MRGLEEQAEGEQNSGLNEEYGVSVAARIIYQLGEQLISDEFVALAELIKNSYDADCITVKIKVDTKAITPYGQGRITIEDNGNGMTREIITNNFLRISTSFKKTYKYSPYFKRRTLGEKGLGRLSIQRLGNHLTLVTVPRLDRIDQFISKEDLEFSKKFNQSTLVINWNDFKDSDGDLSSIKAKCSYSYNEMPKYGTRIVIEGIRNLDLWYLSARMETRIRTEIFGMVNPFAQNNSQRFQISLQIDDKIFSNEKINENVLEMMSDIFVDFKLKNKVLELDISFRKHYIERLLEDLIGRMYNHGFKNYEVINPYTDHVEKIKIDLTNKQFDMDFPYLKEVKLQNHYDMITGAEELAYPGDFTGKLFISEQSNDAYRTSLLLLQNNNMAFKTIKELKAVWQAAVGIYLFRNDFRIFPYGPGVDWLGVTARSQRLKANALKDHTVAGYVQLDSISSEKLVEQTNRNGLIEDEYGKNFLSIMRSIIAEIVTRQDIKMRSSFNISEIGETDTEIRSADNNTIFKRVTDRDKEKQAILINVKQAASRLKDKKQDNIDPILKDIEDKIEQLERLNLEDREERMQENFTYQQKIIDLQALVGLAGQGMIVEALTHEMHRIESNIRHYAQSSRDIIGEIKSGFSEELTSYQDNIIQEVVYLQQQLEHLEPTYKKNKLLLEKINITKFLTELYFNNSPMAKKASENNIAVNITGGELILECNKGLLITIFDNLFLNSLFWVTMSEKDKEIYFEVDPYNNLVVVYDSGPGIHRDIENILFQPYESMKPDGRGLGLYIVNELIKSINASIYLDKSNKNEYGNYYRFIINFKEN